MSRPVSEVQNTGTWEPIINWLDELAGGRFSIPVFKAPPITRQEDGVLVLHRPNNETELVPIGDWVILDDLGVLHHSPASVSRLIRATRRERIVEENTQVFAEEAKKPPITRTKDTRKARRKRARAARKANRG